MSRTTTTTYIHHGPGYRTVDSQPPCGLSDPPCRDFAWSSGPDRGTLEVPALARTTTTNPANCLCVCEAKAPTADPIVWMLYAVIVALLIFRVERAR